MTGSLHQLSQGCWGRIRQCSRPWYSSGFTVGQRSRGDTEKSHAHCSVLHNINSELLWACASQHSQSASPIQHYISEVCSLETAPSESPQGAAVLCCGLTPHENLDPRLPAFSCWFEHEPYSPLSPSPLRLFISSL